MLGSIWETSRAKAITAVKRSRGPAHTGGAASGNVSTVVPTAMIVLLITPWTTSGLPTTFWYRPKSGGHGTSRADGEDVALRLQRRRRHPVDRKEVNDDQRGAEHADDEVAIAQTLRHQAASSAGSARSRPGGATGTISKRVVATAPSPSRKKLGNRVGVIGGTVVAVARAATRHDEDGVEGLERVDEVEQEDGQDHRPHQRHRDVDKPAERPRAVERAAS